MTNTPLITPLFRGATKPVMFIGIPINALVITILPLLLLLMLTWEYLSFYALLFVLPAAFAVPVMRQMTKADDQYLNMWLLELREKYVWLSKNRLDDITVIPPKPLRYRRFIRN